MTTELDNLPQHPDERITATAESQAFWRRRMAEQTVGQVIAALRQCEGWSQAEGARRMGLSRQRLNDYEKGRRLPSIETALQMATALGLPPEDLLLDVINEQLRRAQAPLQIRVA